MIFWNFIDVPTNTTGSFNAFELSIVLMVVGTVALFSVSYLRQKRHSQEKEAQPLQLEA